MDAMMQDSLLFVDRHQAVYLLYACFQEKLLARFLESRIKVQKSQISYYNRHLYACVSFLKVKKRAELPDDYFVLTLGLPAPLESDRVAAKTEPYPGRWTTHFVISSPSDLDEELGDVAWYLAEATTALDIPLETVFQGNLDKLWQRFSNGFDTGASVNRKEDDL